MALTAEVFKGIFYSAPDVRSHERNWYLQTLTLCNHLRTAAAKTLLPTRRVRATIAARCGSRWHASDPQFIQARVNCFSGAGSPPAANQR